MRFDIYCQVVDNYGDAGVCLRLARELKLGGDSVRLFCDRLEILRAIATMQDEDDSLLFLPFESGMAEDGSAPDAVIAAFLCHLPPERVKALQQAGTPVIYLDYLSAESWVEDFHGLQAPAEFANGWYFYPGFTPKTGGLLIEQRLQALVQQPHDYASGGRRQVTLFSYHNEALLPFLRLLDDSVLPTSLTVFEGLALANLNELTGLKLKPGDCCHLGKLTVRAQAMVSQARYDEILCQSDLNLVRGEDSIVRALVCGRPCLWQIYPQAEDTHIVKLKAFLSLLRDKGGADERMAAVLDALFAAYNGRQAFPGLALDEFEEDWRQLAARFSRYLLSLPSLAQSLRSFCALHSKKEAK